MTATIGTAAQLERDEARVGHVYQDSTPQKYWTIGVGCLVDERKGGRLCDEAIDVQLQHDITEKLAQLRAAFSWVYSLTEPRRSTLVQMAFQLGIDGLKGFPHAMAAMQAGDYAGAAAHFADSLVAREQSPARWARHCQQIITGEWQ